MVSSRMDSGIPHPCGRTIALRNRYSEGTDDGQMTPCGYPNFNSEGCRKQG